MAGEEAINLVLVGDILISQANFQGCDKILRALSAHPPLRGKSVSDFQPNRWKVSFFIHQTPAANGRILFSPSLVRSALAGGMRLPVEYKECWLFFFFFVLLWRGCMM